MASSSASSGTSGEKRKRADCLCTNLSCREDLTDHTYYELSCGCEICPDCFGECHAVRNLAFPTCPTCGAAFQYHTSYTFRIGRSGRSGRHMRKRSSVCFAIQGQCDAVDEYLSLPAEDQLQSTCFLVFSRVHGDRSFTAGPATASAASAASSGSDGATAPLLVAVRLVD